MIKKYIRKAIENALLSTMDCYNLEIIKKRTARKIKDDYEKVSWDGIVECETCGCLLKKENAIKGKNVIRDVPYWYKKSADREVSEEYIHTPHYCKVHAPKINPKKEQK